MKIGEESGRKLRLFGLDILESMYEKNLLKYVCDTMVVRVFYIILNSVNYKITNLSLYIRKE